MKKVKFMVILEVFLLAMLILGFASAMYTNHLKNQSYVELRESLVQLMKVNKAQEELIHQLLKANTELMLRTR